MAGFAAVILLWESMDSVRKCMQEKKSVVGILEDILCVKLKKKEEIKRNTVKSPQKSLKSFQQETEAVQTVQVLDPVADFDVCN